MVHLYKISGNGPAAPVLAGLVFLKVKIKFHFTKANNSNASVILYLLGLLLDINL